ncbi:hypothetical protein B566_EDAN013104 [Ephemera danica]|nr:hypothetical protein B566_EDAN013104 [Ephemera danica]
MLLRTALLFAGLALAAASTTGPQLVFPRSSELVYSWRADVSTGATSPDNLDNHASHFGLSANVRVRSDAAAKRVLFKIEGLKFSAYNGRATRGKLPAGAYQMLEFVQTNCSCRLPFAAAFDAGKVSHAEFQANDALFSRNVKKSILSQFQLDLAHISSSPAFQTAERGITGLCPVEHLVTRRSAGHVALRKFWDAKRCDEEPTVRMDNMSPRPCGPRQMSPISSTSERLYELRHEGEDVLLVDTVRSRSGISLQPRGLLTENHFHVTNQTLQLVSTVEAVEEESWDLQGDVVKTSLVFAFPRANLESGAQPDMSFGKIKHNHTAIVDMAETLLERMASRLDSEAPEALRPEQLHTLDVQHLLGVLRVLDVASLRSLSERILLGTSYQAETVRSLALELLPRVGTLAAARLITELITQEKVTPSEADDMLDELPFHLRHPSERLLHDCKPLLDLGTSDAILAYASLVGKVCSTPGVCSHALIDEYAKLFFGKLRDSEEYASQLLYLQAMNNVRVGPVAEYLEPLIQGRLNYSHQLRFLAVWAAMESHAQNPDKAYSVYWPMLADTQEHPEMRHAALTMLLLARPTPDRFMNLLWFLSGERDAQLYNMFYTSVQSLLDTNHPCFLHMTGPARQVARLIPKPPTTRLRSHNHIFDFNDPESGSGVKFQEVVIADESTGFASVMYVDVVPHYLGIATSQLAIHLRVEGDVVQSLVGGKTAGSEHGTLHNLLKSLNVTPRFSQPAHVELLYLDVAASLESVQASDLGLPVTISLQRPELLSIRGNFSTERQGSALVFNTHFDLRWLRQQSYGMYTMSPVTGNWHGVTRANSMNAHWPLRSSFALDMAQFSVKLRFDWPQNQRAAYGGVRVLQRIFLTTYNHMRTKVK